MDFTLTTEQQLLHETMSRLARDRWGFTRRAGRTPASQDNAETWKLMAELGLLAVPFSEEEGGMGGGGTELMILHQAFGRGLASEPYIATILLGGGMVARLGTAQQRATILPEIVAGRRFLALAYLEPRGRYNPLWVETCAERDGTGYRLSGHKSVVLNGDVADSVIVTARTSGEAGDSAGISAFLLDTQQLGVVVQRYATVDGRGAADIRLDRVRVEAGARLGAEGMAAEALQQVVATGCAALCAEAIGAMEVACDLTLEYLKTRNQFGGPIGKFQVLQHRAVDMRIALEKATSMAILVSCSLNAPANERDQRVAAAKSLIGRAGRFIAEQAIQLHGGMGMTDEAAVSHYAKRLIMVDHWFGDADYHLQRFADLAFPKAGARMSSADSLKRDGAAA